MFFIGIEGKPAIVKIPTEEDAFELLKAEIYPSLTKADKEKIERIYKLGGHLFPQTELGNLMIGVDIHGRYDNTTHEYDGF